MALALNGDDRQDSLPEEITGDPATPGQRYPASVLTRLDLV